MSDTPLSDTGDKFSPDEEPAEVAGMSDSERLAYWEAEARKWKTHSKKHEKRARANFTREQALLEAAVRAEFRARLPHLTTDDLDEIVDDINVTGERFLPDGKLDLARVDRIASRFAVATESTGTPTHEPAPRFNLGDIVARDSRRHKTSKGNERQTAYTRTRDRFTHNNQK